MYICLIRFFNFKHNQFPYSVHALLYSILQSLFYINIITLVLISKRSIVITIVYEKLDHQPIYTTKFHKLFMSSILLTRFFFFSKNKNLEGSFEVTSKVASMWSLWSGGHRFKPWKEPIQKWSPHITKALVRHTAIL